MIRSMWMAAVLILVGTAGVEAQRGGRGGGTGEEPRAVVQVNDEVRVVLASSLKDLQKQIADDYKAESRRHAQAQAAARKAREEFDEPKPRKPVFRVIEKSVPSVEKAEQVRTKAQQALDRKRAAEKTSSTGFLLVRQDEQLVAIEAGTTAQFKRDLDAGYRKELRAWEEATRLAKLKKTTFDQPKPVRPKVVELPGRFSTRAEAEAEIARLAGASGDDAPPQ